MSMHPERRWDTTYRVERLSDVDLRIYHVTIYSPVEGSTRVDTLVNTTLIKYIREDALPTWVHTGMDMLDIAAVDGESSIPFFGTKQDGVYWFQAKQLYDK